MKMFKTHVAIFLMALASMFTVSAGEASAIQIPTMPESLPINSIAVLRSYALEQAGPVYGSLWSQSQLPTSGDESYIYQTYKRDSVGTDPKQLLSILSSRPLLLKTANPFDWCYAFAEIENTDGDTLFSAYSSFLLVSSLDGYCIPKDSLKLNLRMSDHIPIYLPGVSSMRVLERDSKGNIIRDTYLDSPKTGKFYWPSYFSSDACAGGEVIATTWNDDGPVSTVYGLKSGTSITQTSTSGTLDPSIEGVIATRNGNLYGNIYVLVTNGIPPTIVATFDYDSSPQVVIAVPEDGYVWGQWFTPKEHPVDLLIRKEGEDNWSKVSYDPDHYGYPQLLFQKGTYYIVPEWKNLKSPYIYYPPSSGGGKGVVTETTTVPIR